MEETEGDVENFMENVENKMLGFVDDMNGSHGFTAPNGSILDDTME